ncbi:MAG TPA: hypothetical protein DFS52_15450 [Myxococcales bacterium]|nr:hypothetical protein [Myxococcales bacterium]
MKRSATCLALLSLGLVLFGGCGAPDDRLGKAAESSLDSTYASRFATMHVRGTMNGWGSTAMRLVADNEWLAEVDTGEGEQSFKFDVRGDWRENYGDDDGDQNWDRDGRNIPLEPGRALIIHLNDLNGFYWVERRTWSAEVTFALPEGIEAQALAGKQARLYADGQDYGQVLVYVDGARAYAPVCCLERGPSYALKLDTAVGAQRLTGELSWTVDGTVDPIPLQLEVALASLEDFGAVELSVLADRWEGDRMVSAPYGNVGVYLGDWHAGNLLGVTDAQGKLSAMVPAGEHLFSLMLMTSSHSIASSALTLIIQAGELARAEAHLAPVTAVVRAHYDAGMGHALYLAGASEYLGDWRTAQRMTFNAEGGFWSFQANLPVGLPFKIVRGPWSDEPHIDVSQVEWESGDNHAVPPPHGYVTSEIDLWPEF